MRLCGVNWQASVPALGELGDFPILINSKDGGHNLFDNLHSPNSIGRECIWDSVIRYVQNLHMVKIKKSIEEI